MRATGLIKEVREQVKDWRKQGLSVGFVPTMGFLHEGHESLIARAAAENDKVVVSDFVNPIQFGEHEDLSTYPRDFNQDQRVCARAGADLIFHPEKEEMYAPDFSTYTEVENVSKGLCGKSRPTHFRGVCTVVSKLFHIVLPDRAYFGQKDAQQLAVIRRMVRDMDMDIEIVGCPIRRRTCKKLQKYIFKSGRKNSGACAVQGGCTGRGSDSKRGEGCRRYSGTYAKYDRSGASGEDRLRGIIGRRQYRTAAKSGGQSAWGGCRFYRHNPPDRQFYDRSVKETRNED